MQPIVNDEPKLNGKREPAAPPGPKFVPLEISPPLALLSVLPRSTPWGTHFGVFFSYAIQHQCVFQPPQTLNCNSFCGPAMTQGPSVPPTVWQPVALGEEFVMSMGAFAFAFCTRSYLILGFARSSTGRNGRQNTGRAENWCQEEATMSQRITSFEPASLGGCLLGMALTFFRHMLQLTLASDICIGWKNPDAFCMQFWHPRCQNVACINFDMLGYLASRCAGQSVWKILALCRTNKCL